MGVAIAVLATGAVAGAGGGGEGLGLPGKGGLDVPAHVGEGTPEVRVSGRLDRTSVRANDQIAVAVVLDHQPGWHTWPSAEQKVLPADVAEFAIRTTVEVEGADWIGKIGPVQWPEPHAERAANPMGGAPIELMTYSGRAVAYVPLIVAGDVKAGSRTLRVKVGYQTCNDTECLPPEDVTLEIPVEIVAPGASSGAPVSAETADLFKGFDRSVFAAIVSGKTARSAAEINFFGRTFTIDSNGGVGLVLIVLVAMLGGFVLNLTPCVLPVIPIKIIGISQAASNPARCLMLGVIMSLGVVAFWMGIGGAMAFVTGFDSISSLFKMAWFTIVVGAFILVMAVGMLGVFSTKLPQWVYRINPSSETPKGSFLFGIMTAVLATPCIAPFLGSAVAWASQQAPWIILVSFAAIGVGMALPYLVLAANPKWVSKVPRTGPASELVKQVMGLLLVAVSIFFLGSGIDSLTRAPVDPPTRWYWWLIAAAAAVAGGWLAWRTFRLTTSSTKRAVFGVVGLLLAAGGVAAAVSQTEKDPIHWTYWTPERFEKATERGDVVVVDFTAEWCINCKALEAGVLHQKRVVGVLNGPGVTPMKVDLTSGYPAAEKFMVDKLRWPGNVPLLAIFGPRLDHPLKYDSYTVGTVLEAIERAGGPGAASGVGARKPPPTSE